VAQLVVEELLESTDTAELIGTFAQDSCFVAVHIGAGFHSQSKTPAYRSLCESICSEVIELLKQGSPARDAVAYAISLLEVHQCLSLLLVDMFLLLTIFTE
jgi:hypothetical protein